MTTAKAPSAAGHNQFLPGRYFPFPTVDDDGGNTPHYGLPDSPFGCTISWASDRVVVVDAADDLTSPDWIPVSTNTLVDGFSEFTDADWADHPSRFYRLRFPGD